MSMDYLDGEGLRHAVVAGSDWVRQTRRHLNRINVFPVADGDTGTNMALSLSATAHAIRGGDEKHLAKVLDRLSEASILGAKGNSGLILAHWFQGLARGIGDRARISSSELAAALRKASQTVDESIEDPVEGTIITVMRAASVAAESAAQGGVSLAVLINSTLEGAEEALRRTPEMLEVLREAQVVDAGAQGFVNFLQGVQRSIRGLPAPEIEEEIIGDEDELDLPGHDGEIDGRYCTELVIRGQHLERKTLRERFAALGSSMLIATTGRLAKLHIHTDHPDEIFRNAEAVGTIEERKVDDMLRQREERSNITIEPIIPIATQPSTVAILSDSASGIPVALQKELGIELVPLQVLFGDEVFRDGVDLDSAEFYARMERSKIFPTTSQPAPRAFVEALERIRTDRLAIIVSLASSISGTYRSAQTGARLAAQPQVEVFDSSTASLGTGLLAIQAARLAAKGLTVEEILHWLERWRSGTGVYFVPRTLEYLRRGGRIGRAKSMVGNVLGLRPILGFRGKDVRTAGTIRSDVQAIRKIVALIRNEIPDGSRLRIGLGATTDDQFLDVIEAALREHYEIVDVLHNTLAGVVGAHIGPGGWGIFWSQVPEDDPLL